MTRRALLVHGLSSSASSWWRVREALEADGWAVTAVDLRGHGANPPAPSYALTDYAADLPAGPWDVVVAHSLGAAAAVLAAQREGFAGSLVLLDPVLEVSAAEASAVIAVQVAELDLDEASIVRLKPRWDDRDRAEKLVGVRSVDPAAVTRSFTDNPAWNVVAETSALGMPVLILSGDPAVYSMLDPQTARSLQNAEYRVIPNAGHSPHRDEPDATIAALREWLARH